MAEPIPYGIPVAGQPTSYPNIPIHRIDEEEKRWIDTSTDYASPYRSVFLLQTASARTLRILHSPLSAAQFDTLKDFYELTEGQVWGFTFTHPITGESLLMRFAKQLEWTYDGPSQLYHTVVHLESVRIQLLGCEQFTLDVCRLDDGRL